MAKKIRIALWTTNTVLCFGTALVNLLSDDHAYIGWVVAGWFAILETIGLIIEED